jgi:hypothetical protein
LLTHLHQKIWVVIWFFAVEVDVSRTIDLELFINFLGGLLLVQTLPVDSHFLHRDAHTDTGSLTRSTFYPPFILLAIIFRNKYNLIMEVLFAINIFSLLAMIPFQVSSGTSP